MARGNAKLAKLLANYARDDDDDSADDDRTTDANTNKPWLIEFNQYLNGADTVPSKMSLAQWWEVSYFAQLPCSYCN